MKDIDLGTSELELVDLTSALGVNSNLVTASYFDMELVVEVPVVAARRVG